MADMSPKGVTQRLRQMGDLWLLSIKLKNSRSVGRNSTEPGRNRALDVQESIRRILFNDWNPVGINDSGLEDEYDSFIAPVYRILIGSRSEHEIIQYLGNAETELLGKRLGDINMKRKVTEKLLGLDVRLTQN